VTHKDQPDCLDLLAEELPGNFTPDGIRAALDKYVLGMGKGRAAAAAALDLGVGQAEMQVCSRLRLWRRPGCRAACSWLGARRAGARCAALVVWYQDSWCTIKHGAPALRTTSCRAGPLPPCPPCACLQAAYARHKEDGDWLFLVGQELGVDVAPRQLLKALQAAGVVEGPRGGQRPRVPKALLQSLYDRWAAPGSGGGQPPAAAPALCPLPPSPSAQQRRVAAPDPRRRPADPPPLNPKP
jgi:hypothetical protein